MVSGLADTQQTLNARATVGYARLSSDCKFPLDSLVFRSPDTGENRASSVYETEGSGSIAIETAAVACEGRAYAIEMESESLAFCRENRRSRSLSDDISDIDATVRSTWLI